MFKVLILRIPFLLLICSLLYGETQSQNFQWARQFGGSGWDQANAIVTDPQDNLYLAGYFKGTVDFDPGTGVFNLSSVGETDIFVSKWDPNGDFLWARQFGDSAFVECHGLALDPQGNIYTAGSFLGPADFDPGAGVFMLNSSGFDRDVFVQKLDPNGNFIWAKQVSGFTPSLGSIPAPLDAHALGVDDQGNVVLTGYFDGTVDFDPGPDTLHLTATITDMFVLKLDPQGELDWARQFSGLGGGVGYALQIDAQNNVLSTGVFSGNPDFDPGAGVFTLSQTDPLQSEIYLSKLDAAGNFVWATALGPGQGNALAIDPLGNVYSTGWTPNGYTSMINKHSPAGNLLWARELGGINGWSVSVDPSGSVYTTGACFLGTHDFDPGPGVFNLTSPGPGDAYISKLDSSGDFQWAGIILSTSQVNLYQSTTDAAGNLYTTGMYDGDADFDPSPNTALLSTPQVAYNVFVQKLSPDVLQQADVDAWHESIQVYPNPSSGQLVLEFEQPQEGLHYTLRNLLGQEIQSGALQSGQRAELEIHGSPGVYFLEVKEGPRLQGGQGLQGIQELQGAKHVFRIEKK